MSAQSQAQSYLRYPLTSILGSNGNVRTLPALVSDGSPQPAPRLAEATGLTPPGTRLVLETLTRLQLVIVHGSGRSRLYALNPLHPFSSALVGLFQEEQRRWDTLLESIREVLAKHGTGVTAAWFYGSVARGEDSPDSDLDIAIIVRTQGVGDQVRDDLMSLEDSQQLRISLTTLTPKELMALSEDDHWWSDVVRDGRILKGPAPDQARRRLAKKAE
jgi:predicted nucleotidyltransferase